MNKKTLLIVSLIAFLMNQNVSYASTYVKNKERLETEDQKHDLEELINQIILEYGLEVDSDCIMKNQSKFLKFYHAIINNENILPFAQKTMLESFQDVINYLDDAGFERDLAHVSNMHIEIQAETCASMGIAGFFVKGKGNKPDLIGLASEKNDVLLHERIHQIFTDSYQDMLFQDKTYIYRNNLNKTVLKEGNYSSYDISFLNEAIAEDLKSEKKQEY